MNIESLARLAATLIHGDEDQLREEFHRSLDQGIPVEVLREVVYTTYLFDGYPTALEGFRALASVIGPPSPPPPDIEYTANSIARWRTRGERLCRTVYGPQFEKLTAHVAEIAPELADSMLVEGYGKILSRDGLDSKLRELIVVAILAAKHRPRQLLSHCLGALRLGATRKEMTLVMRGVESVVMTESMIDSYVIMEDALRRFGKP